MIQRLRGLATNRAVEVGGTVVGLALLGLVLREALAETEHLRFSAVPAMAAVLLFGLSWLGLSIAWSVLAAGRVDQEMSFRWLRSQLLRYVPGGIWAPVARFVDMEGERGHKAKLLLFETLAILAMAVLLGSGVAAIVLDVRWMIVVLLGIAGLAVIFRWTVRLGHTRRLLVAWYAVLALSLSCYLLASALAQDAVAPGIPFGEAAAAGLLSWVVGYVVFFAPSGVGAKEWAYVVLLGAYASPITAAGVVAARVFWIVAELILFAGALLWRRLPRHGLKAGVVPHGDLLVEDTK